jgi:ABC-2 type transport system permease protein
MKMINRNLFSKETGRNSISLIVWMVVITFLISVTMAIYPVFLENQSKIMGMMDIVPKGALQFKGISNFADLLSVLGFYSVNNVIYMMLLGSIFAIVLGSNILLKEEYEKTAEYLLSRPITRGEVFFSKLAVMVLFVFVLNLVISSVGLLCLKLLQKEPFSIRSFYTLSGYTLMLNMMFGSIGLFMSTLVKRSKPITTLSIGLVLIMYFIYTISKITESAAKLGYLSPFKFVNMDAVNPAYGFEIWRLLYFLGISILLIVFSYRIYLKKDIYT